MVARRMHSRGITGREAATFIASSVLYRSSGFQPEIDDIWPSHALPTKVPRILSCCKVLFYQIYSSFLFLTPSPTSFLPLSPPSRQTRLTAAISSSYFVHSGTCLLARSSFGSFVSGLLHRSIVLAFVRLSSLHHVSHHNQSMLRLWIGSTCCI